MSETGELPAGWESVPLREVTLPGSNCNPRDLGRSTFLYVDIEALDNTRQVIDAPKQLATAEAPSRARVAIRSGDVLFSLVRPYLKNVAIVPRALDGEVASTAFCRLRPGPGIDSRFLFHQLCQERLILSVPTYGTSPPAARDEEFLDTQIVVAPGAEQQRVVSEIEELLSDLDAGVAALERTRANLVRHKASVLNAAVEGRLTKGWRGEHSDLESATVLLDCMLRERRAKWEEEQFARYKAKGQRPPKGWREKYKEPRRSQRDHPRTLPNTWCYTTLGSITDAGGDAVRTGPFGSLLKKHEHLNEGVQVLGIENVRNMSFSRGSKIHVSDEKARELVQYDAVAGDVLISRSGTVGEACVVPDGIGHALISTNLMRVRLNQQAMAPDFFVLLLSGSPDVASQIEALCSGSTRDFLNKAIMLDLDLPLPPLEEQKVIVQEVSRLVSVNQSIAMSIDASRIRSTHLHYSILSRAFSGKLVPQDSSDEPASALLDRIRAERMAGAAVAPARKPRAAIKPAKPDKAFSLVPLPLDVPDSE